MSTCHVEAMATDRLRNPVQEGICFVTRRLVAAVVLVKMM